LEKLSGLDVIVVAVYDVVYNAVIAFIMVVGVADDGNDDVVNVAVVDAVSVIDDSGVDNVKVGNVVVYDFRF
jgi:hypothetical protein